MFNIMRKDMQSINCFIKKLLKVNCGTVSCGSLYHEVDVYLIQNLEANLFSVRYIYSCQLYVCDWM